MQNPPEVLLNCYLYWDFPLEAAQTQAIHPLPKLIRQKQNGTGITHFATDNDNNNTEVTSEMTPIQLIINGQEFELQLNYNESARHFTEMLPMQLDMQDLHDNE